MHMQLIGLLLIATLTSRCSALECYKCTNCKDNYTQKPPASGCEFCQTKTKYENNELKQISRDCVQTCTQSSTVIKGEGDRIECCKTDLCNGATFQMGTSICMLVLCFSSLIIPW